MTDRGTTDIHARTDAHDTETGAEAVAAPVEVRRNGALAAAVAAVAGLVAAAYLARAASTGGLLDWAVFLVMGVLTLAYARSWLDARTPLLVADGTGIRLRLGSTWHGLPWEDLEEIEHAPRQGLLRDGRLVAFPIDPEAAVAALDPVARRQAAIAQKVHGAPFALPLGLTTRVSGADEGLTQALLALAPDPELVVEVVPGAEESDPAEGIDAVVLTDVGADPEPAPGPELGTDELDGADDPRDSRDTDDTDDTADTAVRPHGLRHATQVTRAALQARSERLAEVKERNRERAQQAAADKSAERAARETTERPDARIATGSDAGSNAQIIDEVGDTAVRPGPLVATATPDPGREPSRAVRRDLTRHAPEPGPRVGVPAMLEDDELEKQAAGYFAAGPDDTGVWRSTTVVIDELAGPAHDPVIGPRLTQARESLGLSVDQLAERTRIRAHVIEAVEVDDFGPCGGDFYARGHLRTLARVLGVDATPLLATYDERYAAAPIAARRVFEAELSTGVGGSIRSLRGGPNWSVVVAAVMAVVLAWSVARLVMDQPQDSAGDSPSLSSGSAGLTSGTTDLPPPVPVVLTAEGGGARVVVRDGAGEVLFKGDLAFGQSRTVKVSPPIRVQSSDGSLTVGVDGQDPERMGQPGRSARDTFVP